MPSILIHGGSPQTRQERAEKILQDHYVHHFVDEVKMLDKDGKLGVDGTRKLLPKLFIKPLRSFEGRGVLILEAQQLNEHIQNTLLKTLEEPPELLTFVLTVPHPRLLLPTVVSRCLIEIAETGDEAGPNRQLVREIWDASFGHRLAIFEEKIGYNRPAALSFLEGVEQELAANPTPILKELWEAKKLLRDDTTSVKMVVDRFLLSC